ncbi:hypothetical protein BC939DRAFT_467737, partial [Gamsiella multidivaricata]|uniref:uncharacterized protein n=1 Tax=Gamsiella multidivaricata TaxID=101098 RepID=UPI00221F0E87
MLCMGDCEPLTHKEGCILGQRDWRCLYMGQESSTPIPGWHRYTRASRANTLGYTVVCSD